MIPDQFDPETSSMIVILQVQIAAATAQCRRLAALISSQEDALADLHVAYARGVTRASVFTEEEYADLAHLLQVTVVTLDELLRRETPGAPDAAGLLDARQRALLILRKLEDHLGGLRRTLFV